MSYGPLAWALLTDWIKQKGQPDQILEIPRKELSEEQYSDTFSQYGGVFLLRCEYKSREWLTVLHRTTSVNGGSILLEASQIIWNNKILILIEDRSFTNNYLIWTEALYTVLNDLQLEQNNIDSFMNACGRGKHERSVPVFTWIGICSTVPDNLKNARFDQQRLIWYVFRLLDMVCSWHFEC